MYPVLALFDRKCEMVNGSDGYSLEVEPYGDFKVPNGMPMFPAYAMSYDDTFFPNPELFDPERFSTDNKDNIVAGSYFPFRFEPHVCIGERFAMMQVKVKCENLLESKSRTDRAHFPLAQAGLVNILKDYRLEATDKTPKAIELTQKAIIIQSKSSLYVKFVKDPLNVNDAAWGFAESTSPEDVWLEQTENNLLLNILMTGLLNSRVSSFCRHLEDDSVWGERNTY